MSAKSNHLIYKMQSSTVASLLLFFLVTLIRSQNIPMDERPIQMARRDLVPFTDIVHDLKGKTLGGRMRFGKRSMSLTPSAARLYPKVDFMSLYAPPIDQY